MLDLALIKTKCFELLFLRSMKEIAEQALGADLVGSAAQAYRWAE